MENVTCPYCGANVEAERWKTFETCPHCGREYCVSVAASITDGASVAGLRARLDALKEFAEAANATILSSLVAEPGEKLYEELVARLKLELDLRKQTAQSKQSSIASVLPVAKKRCRLRNFFIALFAVIAAAVIGGGLAGAIIFDSGWRAVLCVIAAVIACVVKVAAAALAAPRLAGYKTSVRDLERLREIYRVANADYIKAEKAVESYLPKINNFR